MIRGGEKFRFWLPVIALTGFGIFVFQSFIRAHFTLNAAEPKYEFTQKIVGRRGTIYGARGRSEPLAVSVPVWEYHLDPVALTSRVVRAERKVIRSRQAILRTISDTLKIDYKRLVEMSHRSGRYQFLAVSSDSKVYEILTNPGYVSGVAVDTRLERHRIYGRHGSHILGSLNTEQLGVGGIEQRYQKYLTGVPGLIRGVRDASRHELYDKRIETIAPVAGADVFLTIDHNLQYLVEQELAKGIAEYGAGTGWCLMMDAKTGAVLALASYPDYDPAIYGRAPETARLNRAIAFTYEPGSVMKVITAASALDAGLVRPTTLYATNRDDPRYYRLPGDGRHVWNPYMTIQEAIEHSSNIVIGKLGVDMGRERLWGYMKAFGFGQRTGIELPGEEAGILPPGNKWDLVKCSRAPIGQGVAVTAIQLASAYQALANEGVRMRPYLVSRVEASDGRVLHQHIDEVLSRPVSREAARESREMMLGVASPNGTARRAAIRGYSVAGKTGTAQKVVDGHYSDSLYRATFCGIVPSGVVKRQEDDLLPEPARLVILVTLDFDQRTLYHQGGNSSAPIFKRIATSALRYLAVEPDRPDELIDYEEDEP